MAIVLIVCLASVLCLWVIMTVAPGNTAQTSTPSGEQTVLVSYQVEGPQLGPAIVSYAVKGPIDNNGGR